MKSPKPFTIIDTTVGFDSPKAALDAVQREKDDFPKEKFGSVFQVRHIEVVRKSTTGPKTLHSRVIVRMRRTAYPAPPGAPVPDLSAPFSLLA